MPDPVARNRRITRCYHELSAAVAARAAPGANWCTFATWASAQAGITIRGEDLERAADDVLRRTEVRAAVERLARQLAADAAPLLATLREALGIDAAARRTSAAVAAGNLKVFAEIGREFARWLARRLGRPLPLDVAADALCDAVRRELRVVLTETLMTIHLPGAVVRLGRDVRGAYPPELRAPSLPALRALLSRVDHAPEGPAGSGAIDWSSLDQRMRFIAELFRCWHLRAELMTEP